MTEEKKTKVPPLVDLKVTNPIEYIKLWWKKIIGNEGVEFKLVVHPLTAIAIALAIASVGFGLGRFVFPFSIPFFKYEQVGSPTPAPADWKETAFTGTLHFSSSTSKYLLITSSASEAITLQVPENFDLTELVGKRVLVVGSYNKSGRLFIVADAKNMEVLPKSPLPIPTNSPPTPDPTLVATPTATPMEATSPTPAPES